MKTLLIQFELPEITLQIQAQEWKRVIFWHWLLQRFPRYRPTTSANNNAIDSKIRDKAIFVLMLRILRMECLQLV